MRVVHVIAPVEHGGGESLLLSLLAERRPGLEEAVAALHSSSALEEGLTRLDVPLVRLGRRSIGHGVSRRRTAAGLAGHVGRLPALQSFVSRWGADVVHAHGFPAVLLGAALRGPARVYTHHAHRVPPPLVERQLLTAVYSRYDELTAVSDTVRESLRTAFPALASRFTTVHNCVGSAFFGSAPLLPSAVEAAAAGRRLVVQVGRFVWNKNQDQVVAALAALDTSERDRLFVLFAGEGPQRETVERLARQLGVSDAVMFLGHVRHDGLPGLLAACDGAVFPSDAEGFGLGAVECLASGLPVVAKDHPIMQEVLGPAGILVPDGALHLGLRRLANGVPAELREAARLQATRFSPAQAKDRWMKVYGHAGAAR